MGSCNQGLKYALSVRLEIHPCVLQDIGRCPALTLILQLITPSRAYGRTEGHMEIHPCVLQDIGPLGPLPKKVIMLETGK